MQLRLTPNETALAEHRERESADTLSGIDWTGIVNGLSG
jgi:hypothetical protein